MLIPISLPRAAGAMLVLIVSLLSGCHTGETSRNAARLTDFRTGDVYQLKVPAFILARSGLLVTATDAQTQPPAEAETLLEPGTFFKVRQIVTADNRSPDAQTEVYAEIISGPRKGRLVNLRTASLHDGPPGATRRDRNVFEPFFGSR